MICHTINRISKNDMIYDVEQNIRNLLLTNWIKILLKKISLNQTLKNLFHENVDEKNETKWKYVKKLF